MVVRLVPAAEPKQVALEEVEQTLERKKQSVLDKECGMNQVHTPRKRKKERPNVENRMIVK